MSTATYIKPVSNMRGDARLYRVDPPLDGNEYIAVSAVDMAAQFPGINFQSWEATETYIFPASEDGEVTAWGELPGSMKGTLDHAEALRDAGYEEVA